MERDNVARELVAVAVAGFKLAAQHDHGTPQWCWGMGEAAAVKAVASALGISLTVYMDAKYAEALKSIEIF